MSNEKQQIYSLEKPEFRDSLKSCQKKAVNMSNVYIYRIGECIGGLPYVTFTNGHHHWTGIKEAGNHLSFTRGLMSAIHLRLLN